MFKLEIFILYLQRKCTHILFQFVLLKTNIQFVLLKTNKTICVIFVLFCKIKIFYSCYKTYKTNTTHACSPVT